MNRKLSTPHSTPHLFSFSALFSLFSLSLFVFLIFLITQPVSAKDSHSILQDLKGNPSTIEQHTNKGKWLLVMYWESNCHICNQEAAEYEAFHKRHTDKDATVLGISLDGLAGKAKAESFIDRHHISFPNLIGEADDIALQFVSKAGGASFGTPSFLLYDPKGKLRAAELGAVPVKALEAYIKKNST